MKIAIIGCGNMGRALINGLLKSGISSEHLIPIDPSAPVRAQLEQTLKLRCSASPDTALNTVQLIILAVKPHALEEVARQITPYLTTQLVISIAAGIRIPTLTDWLGGYTRIVRAIPNLPASIGYGITGLAALPHVQNSDRVYAERILSSVGQTLWCLDENQLDAVTAVSGSGPAYVFYFIEALENAACQLGFDETQARALTRATFTGAAMLAAQQSDTAASTLSAQVSPPNGTTAAALASFSTECIKEAIARGVLEAHRRAIELASTPNKER